MPSFFRKSRQSIQFSSTTRKYLIYAIGEIFLVVIGILLALQINNWNEYRKEKIIESTYLIALEKEFEANQAALDRFISLNEQLVETAKIMLQHTGVKIRTDITEDQINQMLIDLIKANVEYEPSPGILEDLISSGNLNKLSNTTLRKQLSDWKAQLATVRRQENTVLEYRFNIKGLLIEQGNTRTPVAALLDIDKGTFKNNNIDLLTNSKLENNLSFFAIASTSLGEAYYGDLQILISNILKTIRSQLENSNTNK